MKSRLRTSLLRSAAVPARRSKNLRRSIGAAMELLEPRQLLSLTFPVKEGVQALSNGGTVATGNVPIYLIFAGGSSSGFGFDGSLTSTDITNAVGKILASP